MTDIRKRYDMPYTVPSSVIDAKCRLTPVAVASIAQDLAAAHYGLNGLSIPHLQKRGYTWIIAKQRYEITEYPLWLDEMILSTWSKTPKGPFAFRDYQIRWAENGRRKSATTPSGPCINSTASWMVLELATGKPVKPTAEIMGALIPQEEDALPSVFPRISLSEKWDCEFPVLPSVLDIDMNGHVNNINYVRWLLSAVPRDMQAGKLVSVLDTYFISSAMEGQNLVCRTSADGDVCVHSIVREADGSEVFRARTEWKPEEALSRDLVLD